MNKFGIVVCSAALSAAALVPAHAEMKTLGTVYLDRAAPTVQFRDALPAPVERIGFKSVHGDVFCDSIRATFSNGRTEELFKGLVNPGGDERALPNDAGTIQHIDFQCNSYASVPGIEVRAELGRHEAAWRNHADWNSKWWYRIAPNGAATPAGANNS